MKPPKSMVSLIFLLVLVGTSQGIRFEEELIAAFRRISHKESFIGGGETAAGGAPCRDDGLCSSGRSRELAEKAMTNSETHWSKEKDVDRNSEFEAEKRKGQEKKKKHEEERAYPDVLDIAGMDYTPARRKPPIHN